MSIFETDKSIASVSKGPRISVKDIEDYIAFKFEFNGESLVPWAPEPALTSLKLLSMCVLVMKNGFTIIGKSAPMSSENFNFALGQKLAYEDALRQLWPLMAFSAKDKATGE